MESQIKEEVLFYAPLHGGTQFVEFRLDTQGHKSSESPWGLKRRIVDQVDEMSRLLVTRASFSPGDCSNIPSHMSNITVIDSRPPETARAINDTGDPYHNLLKPLLDEFGIDYIYELTDNAGSIEKLAERFSAHGTVIILGGDTSVHEFVNGLRPLTSKEHEIRIVVLPTGTGNALAISSGLLTPISAVRQLFLCEPSDFVSLSTLPVRFFEENHQTGVITKRPLPKEHRALVVVSWGLHSALVADSNTPDMRAAFKNNPNDRFKEAARINLAEILQNYRGKVTLLTDHGVEHVFGPEHSYLLFTIVTYLEDGFLISPESRPPSDDRPYMVAIKPFESLSKQKEQIMKIMREVYDHGSHVKDPLVDYRALKGTIRVSVDVNQSENMRRWCIDGKIILADAGIVEIGPPSSYFNGWSLLILRG